jgi:hypothetical protein
MALKGASFALTKKVVGVGARLSGVVFTEVDVVVLSRTFGDAVMSWDVGVRVSKLSRAWKAVFLGGVAGEVGLIS